MLSNLPPGVTDQMTDGEDLFLEALLAHYEITQEEWDELPVFEQDRRIQAFCEDEGDYIDIYETAETN